jgi:hypothetical protein
MQYMLRKTRSKELNLGTLPKSKLVLVMTLFYILQGMTCALHYFLLVFS